MTTETPNQVLCTLSFFATGSYQRIVGVTQHLPQRTASRCIRQVVEALNSTYMLSKIAFPQTPQERLIIRQEFQRKYNLPGVIGCIDCTHIALVRPDSDEHLFFNRKGYHSLNVQMADASTAFLRAARAGHIDKIISLLEQGVDINVSNANGLNAIHLASKDGHVDVVRELLQRGAAIDAATKKGNTALHIASLAGQEAVVKLLVQNGAQVNIQSQNGFTPLYMAAQENHDGVVKFLLGNGANQSLATEDGFTPLAVAMQQGHEKVVAVLLEADTRGRVRLPALHIAAKKDDVKAANLLLENEHNPDVTSKSGFTPLHIAAHYGNESVARLLLAKGADVNCPAKHNICPLHVAAKWGKDNMVSLLCENGGNVEARTRDGLTPLHCAARSGHERVAELLLEKQAPITSKSKNGLAPLHMAAQGDHVEAARVLLAHRAPVDDVTVDYLTALHVAAHCGHAKVAKLLLDRNADANARALNGFTPLHIACKKNRIKVVELLLKYGASIQATTESGLTPLHVAAFMGCMNIVIYLLQHEASPDVPTVRGETPLHLAARANQTDIIRILLRNGAAVEAQARERQSALHIASRLGNLDIAELLLQHGADVTAATADRYNALHIAAKHHNHDVAAALIEHNAPISATTKKGFTALHLAAKYGNPKVANLLLAHGSSPDQAGKNGMTPLHVAAQYSNHDIAATLLEKGADAKAMAKNGHTPLHIAARKNQMETAASLLEHGADSNAESKAGFTSLHLAAQQGHTEMCALLLEHGAEAEQQSKNKLAALHLAAQEDRVPVAQTLLKNGANVDICTKGGYTPLHIASHYGQANMVRCLLENDASVEAQTNHGYTALHHAAQQGHINIVNILLEHKSDANAITTNGQTPLDIASKLGYVTVMETLKEVSEPSVAPPTHEKYKVMAPETMLETFMTDSEEEGGEDPILNEQPYRYLTADDMKSLGDDSLPIDVTRDERTESAMSQKLMESSTGSITGMHNHQPEVTPARYNATTQGYCYNVDPTLPNFLVSFLVDARGTAMRGCRGGGVRIVVPPLSAHQPTRITCRYLKPSRINHMPPLMEGEALASRVLEMGPQAAKFLGPVILEVPHYASLKGKEREIVILRSDNGTNWREHNTDATDASVQHILHDTLQIEDPNDEEKGWDAPRITRILTHDFPQYFAVISRIRQEVHAIGPEGGMVSSSVVPQVQAVFPQGALTKKIKVGLQAQIIDSELTAKLLGRGVAVSPVVTVEPRRRKFHKAITLSMPAPRPHTQGMTNQYSTSSAPTLRLLCSISGGTNRAHWEDVTENTPLTFVNDCVSFTTTVSARYWLIDCRHIEDATKMATELYREAIHVPFMSRFVVYAKRTDETQAQLRMFCVTDDKEEKALERIERFIQVAKSRDVEVHEGKPIYLEFGGNLIPVAKSGEQLSIPFRAFRENRVAFPVMIKTQDLEPMCRCQFMRDSKVPKGEPSPNPIAVLNVMVPEDLPGRNSPLNGDTMPHRTEYQEKIWRQRLSDPRLEDICNLLGKDWVALAYELGVNVVTVNQIQAKRTSAAEQAQLMLKLWKTQSGTKAHDNSLELALCRIGRDDIIAPQSEVTNERRIQQNIYQERQASEEIESYKAEEDNKLKDRFFDENDILRESEHDQNEAKYSPEEKSFIEKSEIERSLTPSEESEEDEDVKKSVAERKEQITRKLSSSKIPASKQKKEIREEIIEIKTQIKPDIKKFQDIEQQVKVKDPKPEQTRLKSSPETIEEEKKETVSEEIKVKKEDSKVFEHTTDQFRKYDPSSPAKPTPKHLQRHIRNDSMKFSSGDFSNITITPRKSLVSDTNDFKHEGLKTEEYSNEHISVKEESSSKVEEKLEDGEISPDLVTDDYKDIAEAPLREKITSFESKISKEQSTDLSNMTMKLTKEALKKHTLEHEQGVEYTKEFVREQSKQMKSESLEKTSENVSITTHKIENKSVKETISQFDIKDKSDDKSKNFQKSVRTDSTIVQASSEEDTEFLKKSTDSETETEPQKVAKVNSFKDKELFDSRSGLKMQSIIQPKPLEQNLPESFDNLKQDDDERKGVLGVTAKGEIISESSSNDFSIKEKENLKEDKQISREILTKESSVISAKARQFIETVPEDDSVQECFFSKRIYSDSLEDSEQSDSRRHSEAESLKSDQSDIKDKVTSSVFDERAEYEENVDSGSGFGDEKFEDSVGFTTVKTEFKKVELDKQESESEKESDVVIKKITKRHSRTESMSITKLSDLQLDLEQIIPKQECQIIVTEVEDLDRSFERDEPSDKISSESSREIEISERKSSDCVSDKISSEDAVTEKKTSSEEEAAKEGDLLLDQGKEEISKEPKSLEKTEHIIISSMDEPFGKGGTVKRQSITSAGSGSCELRLEEKRLSDAYSLTESKDYTFEESEDDIPTQGTHVTKVESKHESESRLKGKEQPKFAKLSHGDSLDDVEGFPEDHVIEHIHKLPHIDEICSQTDKDALSDISKGNIQKQEKEQQQTVSFSVSEKHDCESKTKNSENEISSIIKVSQQSFSESLTEKKIQSKSKEKFDISKIRTDTLGQIDVGNLESQKETKKKKPLELDLQEVPEVTNDQVKPIIDDIFQKGTSVVSSKSPILEKDIRIINKDTPEHEKRSYDAKVPQIEERRHSCISPAISLERIAESDIETDEDIIITKKLSTEIKTTDITSSELKKSDSAMKQMADNIEIIIKQASEDIDLSTDESGPDPVVENQDISGQVSVDSIIEEAVNTVEEYLESSKVKKVEILDESTYDEVKKNIKNRPTLTKSLSKDSGEITILPKKKHPRTFSVQSSPEEIEEQIYTDSESDMDKAKVLEIIEPMSDLDGKPLVSIFDTKKIRTDSLDDADDFPEKENEFFYDDNAGPSSVETEVSPRLSALEKDNTLETLPKTNNLVDNVLSTDLVSKSTTESSVTTVISSLTKSSDDEQKSILEECTFPDFSKISSADIVKDLSRASIDGNVDCLEERGTPDFSKKSNAYSSKSSIDSKDTSRDFATNELSKDSTVDLTKEYSKTSIGSVKDMSKSVDDKTYSEDHSSLDLSKTLASDSSEGVTISKELTKDENLKGEDFARVDDKNEVSYHKSFIDEMEGKIAELKSEFETIEENNKIDGDKISLTENIIEDDEVVPDITELNRRCSNLLEDISQCALIKIDSSHVTNEFVSKFSKTPPPSPVDIINKDKVKMEESSSVKHTGLQLKGSEIGYLDANRQSPRASSAGDSLMSETEAHQSDLSKKISMVSNKDTSKYTSFTHQERNAEKSLVTIDQPAITSGAIELVDRTIEKSMDVIDQIKKEQLAVQKEDLQKSQSETFYSESHSESSTTSSSVNKIIGESELKFQSIDPDALISDMVSKYSIVDNSTTSILTHRETETKKISGQEYFSESKQISSSDDDSLVIKTKKSHELKGQEHKIREKTIVVKDGDCTETTEKKSEQVHEGSSIRFDTEIKTIYKSTDDTDIIKVEREFSEQGLYAGRQTKSEEKMSAIKDDVIKKKHEVKISERDLSVDQWGKEYFTEPGELEEISEDDNKSKVSYAGFSTKIVEKDEVLSTTEISEKGKIVSSKIEHHKEESVIESKEHDDLSSDASHAPSFKSETADKCDSTECSPKSKSRSFRRDNEVYEVDFIKEIKVSTSPIKSTFSRSGSQDSHSESEGAPDLPHDDKIVETSKKGPTHRSPIKLPSQQIQDKVLEISLQKENLFDISHEFSKPKLFTSSSTLTKSSDSDTVLELKTKTEERKELLPKSLKSDMSPSTCEISDDLSTISKDLMIKSGESLDTECMIKSLESHEGEILQKSIDSTMSAETLHQSEFSTDADSAFLTGTDHKKDELKLVKEKSLEDICSSGYDTDLSSAEFHHAKHEAERIDIDSIQPLADLSVLEKTIDEVKQSLEAAQGEIISEKNDGSIKYKQSPSEFQFKLLISPERPEVITEEPQYSDENNDRILKHIESLDCQKSDTTSQKLGSNDDTTTSEDEKNTVNVKQSSPTLDATDTSVLLDSGPHSILETESEIICSERFDRSDSSSKDSPVKLRVQKHMKSKLGLGDRRSASDVEGWSSSSESRYQSFEHSESRPLSSDAEVMLTAQSGTEFDTALTSNDFSSRSLRTSKDYFTATSSITSRDSMKSLDSDGSSHVASIDISDASETLVPSANELKEELMESSTYIEQFVHETDKQGAIKGRNPSEDESIEELDYQKKDDNTLEPVGKMKRSHEMRFPSKNIASDKIPSTNSVSESGDVDDDKELSDTTVSSQFKTDEILSSSISKLEISSDQEIDREEIAESCNKSVSQTQQAIPFSVTKTEMSQRTFVDIESEIIPVGSVEYEALFETKRHNDDKIRQTDDKTKIIKTVVQSDLSSEQKKEVFEECIKKVCHEVSVTPFSICEKPISQREFVDLESEIIPIGSEQYEEILKSKSDSSVPKTKIEKSVCSTSEILDSKQSSTSSLKTQEFISTPQTPLSAPSQSSISTDNGREYVLDDIYDISETPELKSDLNTVSSKSELLITTEEKSLQTYEKDQDSPTSDEFEMVDKPNEMDDFIVIEEVAKEAHESDPEGKSVKIIASKPINRHDTEVEDLLIKTSKKQESTSSASGSLSDEELMHYEAEQKKVQSQEQTDLESGKRWIQMQFEGDPRYEYERLPLEDIKEEEMTDFDASRIGSLSSQKESIGSYGSFRNSYGSLSESEMASRIRFRVKGENDDISISSLQEFENLERALMEQYQQNSSSSQDSLNGSLPRRYILSRSQGDDISISSLKEFEGLESACLEALKAEILAKQKEALLSTDPKIVTGSFLEREKRSCSGSTESSPPQKGGSPRLKTGSPNQTSGSPNQTSESSSYKTTYKIASTGSPCQKSLADSAAIRKLIDQQIAIDQKFHEQQAPKVVTVKKFDEKGAYFVPEPDPEGAPSQSEIIEEVTKATSFVCAAPKDGSAESIAGDCEEMMKLLDQEEKDINSQTKSFSTQKNIDEQAFSEDMMRKENGGVDIPRRQVEFDDGSMSLVSEMSSSLASQPSELDSLMTVIDKDTFESEISTINRTVLTSTERPYDLDLSREPSSIRELSPSSGRSLAHSTISFSGKHFTDPASGSWSGQEEELSSSGSFSRGARADVMLGSTDSLEATSSNATKATYNYEVDTPMTGSLTSGGSNTMVSSLDTLDPVTAVQFEHPSTSEHYTQEYEVQEPDSDTERLELDGRVPRAKERTILFDSTDTLSAVSGDGSVKEGIVETAAPTFFIGDTPILRGDKRDDEDDIHQPPLSGSCPASLPPVTHSSPPVPAQRRSLTMIAKSPHTSLEDTDRK